MSSGDDAETKATVKKPTIADQLVNYALARAKLFRTPENEAYATISKDGHLETWPVNSSEFETWVIHNSYVREGKVAYGPAVKNALNTLRGFAIFGKSTHKVHVRYAEHEGRIYLDLANEKWEVVEIDAEGWRVVSDPSVKFVRAPGMQPLPTPETGGFIDELRPFVNLQTENDNGEPDDRDWNLFVACLVAAMRPTGPYPILAFLGEYGSAKSTTTRVFRALVDPANPAHGAPPNNERDLMVSAHNNWIVAFDNLSRLPDWLSDALCRLATGAGYTARKLYTDNQVARIDAARPVLLNSITTIATRPDLLSRAVILTLPPISPQARQDEFTFWRDFEKARPRILGALLTAVSHGLKHFDMTNLAEKPRMADFARWVTACEPAFGWPPDTFIKAYRDHEAEKAELALSASLIVKPVRVLAAGGWEGTASELLDKVLSMAPDKLQQFDARSLSHELTRIEPVLRDTGVVVTRRRGHGGVRLIRLSGDAGDAIASAESATDGDPGDAGDGNSSVTKKKERKKRVIDGDKPVSPASPAQDILTRARQFGRLGLTRAMLKLTKRLLGNRKTLSS